MYCWYKNVPTICTCHMFSELPAVAKLNTFLQLYCPIRNHSSIANCDKLEYYTRYSVSIPCDPVYIISYPARNLHQVYTKIESYHNNYIVSTKCYSSQLASYGTWGAYTASDNVSVLCKTNRVLALEIFMVFD